MEEWFARRKKILSLLLAALFVAHFATVLHNAVDVPYMDEWEALSPLRQFNLSSRPILSYLTYHHLETRLFFTHLQEYVSLLLNGWDNRFYVGWSFAIYGVLLGLHLWVQKRIRPDVPFYVQFFSILLLLTPYFWEAHAWGQQSHIHYSILWTLILIINLFKQRPRAWNYILSLIAVAGMVFSFSRGASAGFALLILFLTHQVGLRRYSWCVIFTLWTTLVYLFHFGILGLERPLTAHVGLVYPSDLRFWEFFINLASGIFGFHNLSLTLGLLSMMILSWTAWSLLRQYSFKLQKMTDGTWQILAVLLSGLAAMGAIAMGRASLGAEGSQLSRYAFANAQLLPYVLLALWMNQDKGNRNGRIALICTLVFCITGFSRSIYKSQYRSLAAEKREGLKCIEEHQAEIGSHQPIVCPQLYPGDIRPMLEIAQRLNVSFIRALP